MLPVARAWTVCPALTVETRVLPPGGYTFMNQLAEGRCLGEAAEAAAASVDGFDLACHLQGLFQLGAVVALRSADTIHPTATS